MNKKNNEEAHGIVRWIADNADMGFYIVTAPPHMQREIAALYESSQTAVYDYSKISGAYEYHDLNYWAHTNADKKIFFILNMQVAFTDIDKQTQLSAMGSFNMSRDALAQLGRVWFFFMTKETEDRLAGFAFDLYSYVRLKAHFESEKEVESKNLLEFEERYNFTKIKEMLARYHDLEERYMALPIGTPKNELLSAAMTLDNIAKLYRDCHDYINALRLLDKIKEIREIELGKEHRDTAATYNDIAKIYNRRGDDDEALEWYHKSLTIKENELGKEHPSTATTYNDIATVYDNRGDYTKALEWYEKALAIYENVIGKEHPYTAAIYNNIAGVYNKQGNYSKALEWYENALEIVEKVLGEEHPYTATTYNNIAAVYRKQGEYTKALEWHGKALTLREKVLGKEHPNTAITYNNIGLVYEHLGDYAKALEWYGKDLKICEKVFGTEHRDTVLVYNNIKRAKTKAGIS